MKIEYYDSIETCPFKRYQKFNKFLLLSGEVGDEPKDLYTRINRALGYNANGDSDGVAKELSNLILALNYIVNEYTPKGAALAIMVKSIDGVECKDISSDGLNKTLEKLSDLGLTNEEVSNKVETIKKKYRLNCRYILKSVSRMLRRS